MDINEKNILEKLNESVETKMNFAEISKHINYEKYKKEKKIFQFPKRMPLALSSFVLAFSLILMIVLIPSNTKPGKINFPDNPTLVNPSYDGLIKDSFETNIGSGPLYDMSGPKPEPPVIDGYFNTEMDFNIGDEENPNDKAEIVYLEMRTFEYIYEVEYRYIGTGLEYVTVYIEKKLAEKIYEDNKEVMDAPNASPLDNVNGSIVKWFYSNSYYDEDKVFWCQYTEADQIYAEIDGYICVGVYNPQERVILREIFSDTQVNIVDNIYTALYFKNEGNEFLTPVNDKAENRITWYASNNIIDETNKYFLFDSTYSSQFECQIDIEDNTIKLWTYAVQDEDELEKNYVASLKDYHIWSNSVILENENPNEELGEITYITYKYKELVQILQDLAKYK